MRQGRLRRLSGLGWQRNRLETCTWQTTTTTPLGATLASWRTEILARHSEVSPP
jgi:hypothetical protein